MPLTRTNSSLCKARGLAPKPRTLFGSKPLARGGGRRRGQQRPGGELCSHQASPVSTLYQTPIIYKKIHAENSGDQPRDCQGDIPQANHHGTRCPTELATLRARVQELEARESAPIDEVAALKGTLESYWVEIASLQVRVTLLSEKREMWKRVWYSITNTREMVMMEASVLSAEQHQLSAKIEEDLVDVVRSAHEEMADRVVSVFNTSTDLAQELRFQNRAMAEKVVGIEKALEEQGKKTDELLALSGSRQQ